VEPATRMTGVSLADLLSPRFAPIQERLLPLLGPGEIVTLLMTSKQFSKIKEELRRKNYDINRLLKRWFRDPVAFRSTQAQCDALIAGALVRQYFSRSTHLSDSMELYIGKCRVEHENIMITFFKEDGYTGHSKTTHTKPDVNGKELTTWLYPPCRHEPPVPAVLLRASMTSELNFISCSKAYSLTPRATFIRKEAYSFAAERSSEVVFQQNIVEGIQTKFCAAGSDFKLRCRRRRVKDRDT